MTMEQNRKQQNYYLREDKSQYEELK
ncbi:uncharacterized protein METZ01_LOCUS93281 [marine metagenome]|uniref:Uncharacterized protein n=1 Tax=marine metagenome TaxID=408172 RepID=A0A381VL81_9ZZZZ